MFAMVALVAWATVAAPEVAASTDDDVVIEVPAEVSLVVGQRSTFEVVVTPAEGRKVQAQAPVCLGLQAPEALVLDDDHLDGEAIDWDDLQRPHVEVGLEARAPGTHVLEADWTFFLCSRSWCRRVAGHRHVRVVATPEPPP